jgi:mediator of replication checkpoint protein 1
MPSSPARVSDASAKPRPKLLAALRKPTAESSESETGSEDESSASEHESPAITVVSKPLAITIHPQLDTAQANDVDESDGEDAYELMKKRLAAGKTSKVAEAAPQQAEPSTHVVATIESSDDEDEMPVRANVRKPLANRTKTASPRTSPSPAVRSRPDSPGLFVTPDPSPVKKKSRLSVDAGSDSESSQPAQNADLQERVRRIREERLAKQREQEAQQKKSKTIQRRDEGSGSDTDGESGRRLTQQAKPTRRAGKKAMEAMARDQQRISRNMQLTHQAKTKKRFTTQDLFKKFNFQAPNTDAAALPTPEPSSALASSDAEVSQIQNTLPKSPSRQENAVGTHAVPCFEKTSALMPETQNGVHSPEPANVDKGKGRAPEFQHLPEHPWMKQKETARRQNTSADTKTALDDAMVELSDSDEDIRVEQPKSRFPVFDRLPVRKQQEAGSLVHLRALAQLAKSPPKGKKGQKSVTRGEMEVLLAQKAREQTAKAREERIAELIKRGHNPETEEERERRQEEIDDMVAMLEKQRQEDLKLAKREKNEAKQNGETIDDLPSSDEEDDDYIGSGEDDAGEDGDENQEEVELELSGSEDEEMHALDDVDDNQAGAVDGPVDTMADENEQPGVTDQTPHDDEDAPMEDDDVGLPVRRQTVNRARNRVIDDDDESDNETVKNTTPTQAATQDDTMAAFGFGKANADVGLTQVFAGTMAELESEPQPAVGVDTEQDSLDFLRSLPETQPGVHFSQASDFMVPNSQSIMSPQEASHANPESHLNMGISQVVKTSPVLSQTQPEDFEPTQDAGFSFSRSPAGLAPPPSTVDTVMVAVAESPIKQKKGKLQRGRRETTVEFSDVEEDLVDQEEEEESEDDIQRPPKPSKDAFRRMQQAAKKARAAEEFDKKNSLAREAVMEQAEESEDEYAGLGGASDDEEGEEDEELKAMIDHNDVKVDERQIAAFYA